MLITIYNLPYTGYVEGNNEAFSRKMYAWACNQNQIKVLKKPHHNIFIMQWVSTLIGHVITEPTIYKISYPINNFVT